MNPIIKNPYVALLLSALIAPGLGQLLTGRLLKGALMMGGLALCLPIAVIKVLSDLASILPTLPDPVDGHSVVTLAMVQAALAPKIDSLTWFLMPLVLIWVWALTDSIIYIKARRREAV